MAIHEPIGKEFDRVIGDLERYVEENKIEAGKEEISSAICFITESESILRFKPEDLCPQIPFLSGDQILVSSIGAVAKSLEQSSVLGAKLDGVVFALFGEETNLNTQAILVEGHDRYGNACRSMMVLGTNRRGHYTVEEVYDDDGNCKWRDFWH